MKPELSSVEAADLAKRVNIAITANDSIFPDVKLPGGTTTKATEYRELAKKGDKWESPVFSVGTAGASTNLPSAPQITRKQGGARQGNTVGASLTDATSNTAGGSGGHGHSGGLAGQSGGLGGHSGGLGGHNGAAAPLGGVSSGVGAPGVGGIGNGGVNTGASAGVPPVARV